MQVQEGARGRPDVCLKSHVQPIMIHKLGFDQNYYTSALIFLIKIVMCGSFP